MTTRHEIDTLAATLLRAFEQEDVTLFVGAEVQEDASALNRAFSVLHVIEGVAAHAGAAVAFDLGAFVADLGGAAIAAAGEILAADDAGAFEFGESLVEPVAIGAADPFGLGGALAGPEPLQFGGGKLAKRIGIFRLFTDVVGLEPDFVAVLEPGPDPGGQDAEDIFAEFFVGRLGHGANLAQNIERFHAAAPHPIFDSFGACSGLWR